MIDANTLALLMRQNGQQQQPQGYTLSTGTPVMPAVAVTSPTNTAMGVQGGAVGGAGMAMPEGATAMGGGGGGMAGAGAIAGAIQNIGDAAAKYIVAGADYTAPTTMVTPATAQLPLASIQPKPQVYA